MTPQKKVEHYIKIAEGHPQGDLDELVDLLAHDAIDAEDAECLIAFVPTAFAHEILAPLGVGLPSEFLLRDFDTGASARGCLNKEPIFVAAKTLAGEMLISSQTRSRAISIAEFSAEMSAARELSQDGGNMKDVVLTEPVLCRVPVEHLKQKNTGFRWKFWI